MSVEEYTREGVHLCCRVKRRTALDEALVRTVLSPSGPAGAEGRGAVFTLKEGDDGATVVRRCCRGGLVRLLLRDTYLFRNRPRMEFDLHTRLFERGLPVVEPIAVAWRQRGPFYSGCLATRYFAGTSLAALLGQSGVDITQAVEAAGRVVRTLHDGGVLHGDLNAMNILLDGSTCRVIDLDKSRYYGAPLSSGFRRTNLARLERSFEKRGLPKAAFADLLRAYQGDGDSPSPEMA